eukprot:CAMPEP_0178447928 /NCGR_PEP_ID=MMETSP0689_2-20121128/41689_1 /TAXON_ID=160604 /ORGANISM="Amphidinium massartii, Strain CS-259" /LENGTH=1651 /DNA_ID=CAMNT_0020073033 /DNA_START=122 /DNA_END=5073 /DNA_ORIENTATION=+
MKTIITVLFFQTLLLFFPAACQPAAEVCAEDEVEPADGAALMQVSRSQRLRKAANAELLEEEVGLNRSSCLLSPPAEPLVIGASYDFPHVELAGPPNSGCGGSEGTGPCAGTMTFAFSCSAASTVQFRVMIISPDNKANSFWAGLGTEADATTIWYPGKRNYWKWSNSAPELLAAAGINHFVIKGKEDGVKILKLQLKVDSASACTLDANAADRVTEIPATEATLTGNFATRTSLPQHSVWCNGVEMEIPAAGLSIPDGTTCLTACAAGYTTPTLEVTCAAGVLSPASFTCTGDACDQPNKWAYKVDRLQRCEEIDSNGMVPSGSPCTPRCETGYTPLVPSLSCSAGLLEPPEFSCQAAVCTAPTGIANVAPAGACAEGGTLADSTDCTPQCAEGYWPSVHHLDCSKGVLSPPTFTCMPKWEKVEGGLGRCTRSGHEWRSSTSSQKDGYACQSYCEDEAQCNFFCFTDSPSDGRYCHRAQRCTELSDTSDEYDTDVSTMQCYRRAGKDDCTVPDVLPVNPLGPLGSTPTVTTPTYVELKGAYYTGCQYAYGKNSCQGFIEYDFQCSAATSITFGAEVTAPDGYGDSFKISVDGSDEVQWNTGKSENGEWRWSDQSDSFSVSSGQHKVQFIGREDNLRVKTFRFFSGAAECTFTSNGASEIAALDGTLTQMWVPSFEEAPATISCDGKYLELGSGASIAYGAECYAMCPWGYSPSSPAELELHCGDGGVLSPSTYSCVGDPCKEPSNVRQGAEQKCEESVDGLVSHGSDCTTRCQLGFTSTVPTLKCTAGVLDPPTFQCVETVCQVPVVANAHADGPCKEQMIITDGVIQSAATCTPHCADGFYPSVVELDCGTGTLTPLSFTCDSEPHYQVEETLCKNACADNDCRNMCYKLWMPPILQEKINECKYECSMEYFLDAEATERDSCRSVCRERNEPAYQAGALTYPQWQYDRIMKSRAPPNGCVFLSGSEQSDCYSAAKLATPVEARVYREECEAECKASVPATATTADEIDRYEDNCIPLCWKDAQVRIQQDEEAKALLGNTTGGVSSEALQALAVEVVKVNDAMNTFRDSMLSDVRQGLTGLLQAQWMSEENARMSGGTGATKVRTFTSGNQPYHEGSFTGPAMLAQHNHANGYNTVGLGEFAAVINGVNFRTRHNDYSFRMPSTTETKYHATEIIPRPPVPPSVLSQPDVDGQIAEMRTYFKAFKDQNVSLRDYRPYFKPVICYLETGWEKLDQDDLAEPFESDRHHIAATGWSDLVEKVRFFDVSGSKDTLENIPWLPTSVFSVEIKNGRMHTHLAKWGYRILCHPIDGDVEVARLRLVKDSYVRMYKQNRFKLHDDAYLSRDARFRVDPRLGLDQVLSDPDAEVHMGRNYLDLLMEQVPGKDNYPANLRDELTVPTTSRLEPYMPGDPERATRGTAINHQLTSGELNTGYYSRYFESSLDAMGRSSQRRGYNDPILFAAMTSHDKIANVSMLNTGSKIKPGDVCYVPGTTDPCPRVSQRWTYATPVEIIYMTPLFEWNPYDLPTVETNPEATGTGEFDAPLSAAVKKDVFFRTPVGFFGSCDAGLNEPPDTADTDKAALWVLDKNGVKQQVVSSGQQIITRCIPGVGQVRLRYIIMPIHEEGSTAYKETKALEKLVEEKLVPADSGA